MGVVRCGVVSLDSHCKVWVWACRWGKSGISQGRPVIPQPPLSVHQPPLCQGHRQFHSPLPGTGQ